MTTFGLVHMDCDVSFVFSGPIYICSWNKTFSLTIYIEKYCSFFYFCPYPVDSIIFRLFYVNIQTVLDKTWQHGHSSLDSFSFTSIPLNFRDSRYLYRSRLSIFFVSNSPWDSKYTSSQVGDFIVYFINGCLTST